MSTPVPMYGFGGGGGAALNFKVVPGSTQPGTAAENTIWVKTEKINNWYFSATQPEGMQEWDVWFQTGTESAVEFDVLKKNSVIVYPLKAKQMVSGTLKDVTAKSYQNGEWVQWIRYLYNAGNEYADITGGWTHSGFSVSGFSVYAPTKKADCIALENQAINRAQLVGTAKKVAMDDMTMIKVTYKNTLLSNGSGLEVFIQSGTTVSSSSAAAYKKTTSAAGTVATEEIPIPSVLGDYYIIFLCTNARNAEIYSVEYI